jgi:hypothetical protein
MGKTDSHGYETGRSILHLSPNSHSAAITNLLSAQSILEEGQSILDLIEREGPFDGVLGYSAGAALAAQIMCSDGEKYQFKTSEEHPFRLA